MVTSKTEAQLLLGKSNSYFSMMNKEAYAKILELGNGCIVKGYGMYIDNILINKEFIKEAIRVDRKRVYNILKLELYGTTQVDKSKRTIVKAWCDNLWIHKDYYQLKTYYLFDRVAKLLA